MLRELGHFIHLLETEPHNPVERRACVEAKLGSIDEQVERLRTIREQLSARLAVCECCNAPTVSTRGVKSTTKRNHNAKKR